MSTRYERIQMRRRVYETVKSLSSRLGYSPTLREIGKELGIAYTTAREHLRALEDKGFVILSPSTPRSIRLTDLPYPGPEPVEDVA